MAQLTIHEQKRIDSVIEIIKEKVGFSFPEDDLLELAEKSGVTVYEKDLSSIRSDLSGVIEYDDDSTKKNPRIYLNSGLNGNRKLFTLAHELGHHFLHNGRKLRLDTLDYSKADTKEETEANYFAASLLVPKDILLYRIRQNDTVEELAKYFKVSVAVINNRIKWINAN